MKAEKQPSNCSHPNAHVTLTSQDRFRAQKHTLSQLCSSESQSVSFTVLGGLQDAIISGITRYEEKENEADV